MRNYLPNNHIFIFIKGIFVSLLGVLILGIINFLIRRNLALTLSAQDFGFLYSAMSLCMIFLSYLDLGLGQSATILLSKSVSEENIKESNSIFTIFLSIKFLCAFLVFLILVITYKFWLYNFFKYNKIIPYFAIVTILISNTIVSAPYAVLTALKKFIQLNLLQVLGPLLILILLLTIKNNEVIIPSVIFPLSSFIVFILASLIIARSGFIPQCKYLKNSEALKTIFHLSKWVAISTAGLSTMYYLDSLMLTYFRTLQEVALYNVALSIMQIAQSLMIMPLVFIPIVSEMWQKKKSKEIADICNVVIELLIYISWPIAFTIILISKYLIIFLFSARFTEASTTLIILFIGNIFYTIANFYMFTLNSGSDAKSVTYSIIIGNIVNIILNFLLVPIFGITGAASATALSYFSILISLFLKIQLLLKNYLNLISYKKLLLNAIIGTFGIVIAIMFRNYTLKVIIEVTIVINLVYFAITYIKLKKYFITFIRVITTNEI